MNFDDQDWELAHPHSEEGRDLSTVWKVAAGVAVGMVLGGVLVYAMDRQPTRTGRSEPARSIEQVIRSAEPSAAGGPVKPPPAATEPTPQDAIAEPARAAQAAPAAPVVDGPSAAEAAQREAQRAAERKARAWALHYKKPAACDENPTKDVMIECANHFIRARRQFEEAYAAGKR